MSGHRQSEFDVNIGAGRPRPAGENPAVIEVRGVQDVARFHQGLSLRPAQTMPLTVQLDVDMCDFRHRPMVGDERRVASAPARWPGEPARTVR